MKKRAAIGILAILGACGLIFFMQPAEPRHNGRTLGSWLLQYSEASMEETQRLAQAKEAVSAMEIQQVLPRLLVFAKTTDDPPEASISAKIEEFGIKHLHWRSRIDCQLQAIAGFEILGTNAAPAVPELTKLLDDKQRTFIAARCLENIGPPAKPALIQCLTNQNWQVRYLSVSALASATDDVEEYLALLKLPLKDPAPGVRFITVQDIGLQENAPELAVPMLISALSDNADNITSQAVDALGGFGTNAANAFAILTNLATTGQRDTARAALKALATIAPEKATLVLSNAVVNGAPETLDVALKSLRPFAPDLALKMTLDQFHAPDKRRRQRAISVALSYDTATPGIAAALKAAAEDTDPEVAKHAEMTMRQMLRQQKEDLNADVKIPNEPFYQGKSLGAWLKMRNQQRELPIEAIDALRQIGTNAIPSLLARLTYKDPALGLYREDVNMDALTGFIALEEKAKPALPELALLMQNENSDVALRAMLATVGTGSNAIPCLIAGLTNQWPIVRAEAANNLADWGGKFSEQRKAAIPFLLSLLNDPDEDVRRDATNGLKQIDLKAAANAGIK